MQSIVISDIGDLAPDSTWSTEASTYGEVFLMK